MKKVVLASFVACAVLALGLPFASAQDAAPAAAPAAPCQAGAQVQMPAPEYAVYNNAMTQTTPQAKAAGLEQYLTQFPQSCVKENTLEAIMVLYYSFDHAKALDAAERVLQMNPTNIKALFVETLVRSEQAATITDPTAKQAALDTAASFAQKGLVAPKPAGMSDADFNTLKTAQYPTFYSAIGYAAMNKNDAAAAIDAYKKELASVPVDATKTPGAILQDTFYLGQEYMKATPPDYLDCAFYTSRAVAYAPDSYKAIMSPTAKYCYRKYHGADDGYDAVVAAATANLNPPAGFKDSVKPAPTPADIVNQVIATTPDLSTLAVGDKEFILQNGTPDQAAKVWDLLKGKSYQIDGTVVSATPTQIQLSVSDDAKQSKTADFTINLAAPEDTSEKKLTPLQAKAAKAKADALAAATTVGATATVAGTYDSFTPSPIMITMKDGEVILPKAATTPKATPKAAPHAGTATHHTAATHH
jgi:tetratricopeptide (TPR) repeat protein